MAVETLLRKAILAFPYTDFPLMQQYVKTIHPIKIVRVVFAFRVDFCLHVICWNRYDANDLNLFRNQNTLLTAVKSGKILKKFET